MMSRLSIEFNCKIEVDGNACCEVLEELRDSSLFNRYLNRRDKNPPPAFSEFEQDDEYEDAEFDINDPIYDGSEESIRKLKHRWMEYGW